MPGLVRLSDGQDRNGYGVAEFVDGLTGSVGGVAEETALSTFRL